MYDLYNKAKNGITIAAILLILVVIVAGCEEEIAKPRIYPRLKTLPVQSISENGAVLAADIYTLGSEPVIEHGFVWATGGYEPTLSHDRIYLGPASDTGQFFATITSGLIKEKEYIVRPFAKTRDYIVYGSTLTFKSLGSKGPEISGFEPDSAAWEDTLKIFGRNFSWITANNIIKLNSIQATSVYSCDTLIKILINPEVNSLKSVISLTIADKVTVFTRDTFRLKAPVLYDFYPKQARWGDTIRLKGRYITSFVKRASDYLKLGNFKCSYLDITGDSVCSFIISYDINQVMNEVLLKESSFNLTSSELFQLQPPFFNISGKEGTWGDIVTVKGLFNINAARNKFYFDNAQATVISTSRSEVKLKVPNTLSKTKSQIRYEADPFKVLSTDTFSLRKPAIYSILPVSGSGGTPVTIKGKYFKINYNGVYDTKVYFGTEQATINSMNDSIILVSVPKNISGLVKITVKVLEQSIESATEFEVKNPVITRIYPLTGTFNDEVTVEGNGLISSNEITTVCFGNYCADIIQKTATSIVFKVPVSLDSIPHAVTVSVGSNSVVSAGKFTLAHPVIHSLSSSTAVPGQEITITGDNFNPDPERNIVTWDIYTLTSISATKTGITARWPASIPRGAHPIRVKAGGYLRSSSLVSCSVSPWKRINAPSLSTNSVDRNVYSYMRIMGISVKGKGYLCSPASEKMFQYNPTNDEWSQIITNYPFNMVDGITMVVCHDTLSYLCGYDYTGSVRDGLYTFKDDSKLWTKVSSFPNYRSGEGMAFVLKNMIYYGARDFNKCDPGNSYSWTKVANLPYSINRNCATYFSMNEKGYILYNNNELWMYDPDTDLWTKKGNFPGPSRTAACSFIIGDKAFVGMGSGTNDELSDIWRYDFLADSWTKVADIPGKRSAAAGFTINGKAYIGYGTEYTHGYSQLVDFYEFDPALISK